MLLVSAAPRFESETKPTAVSATSNSISFHFQTEAPLAAGTEKYYRYYIQFRVADDIHWLVRPPIDHPVGFTAQRQVIPHTISDLAAGTEYEVQVAVCRVWYDDVRECTLPDLDQVVSITTGGSN